MDKPLYKMLNPENNRIKYKHVPYKLESYQDIYVPGSSSKPYDVIFEGIT